MGKDIYKGWSRKKLKGEILKFKLIYHELFDDLLKTQEENIKLIKAYNICDEANNNLKEEIKALRKELNEHSYVALEDNLTKAIEILKKYHDECPAKYSCEDIDAMAEQFLKEFEK